MHKNRISVNVPEGRSSLTGVPTVSSKSTDYAAFGNAFCNW